MKPKALLILALCLLPLAACQRWEEASARYEAQKQRLKEKTFDAPDSVGSLGGIPIRFSGYIGHGPIDYEDTPTVFSREWENYEPPPRTLESKIVGFSFDLNLDTGQIYHPRMFSFTQLSQEQNEPASPWISAGFEATRKPLKPHVLNRYLADDLRNKPTLPSYTYRKTDETRYGLEVYKQLELHRHTNDSYTVFIGRDKQGNVSTYIKCSDKTELPNPTNGAAV